MNSCSGNLTIHQGLMRFVARDTSRIRVEQSESDVADQARRQVAAEVQARLLQEVAALREDEKRRWAGLESAVGDFMKSFEKRVEEQLVDLSIRIAEIVVRRELPDREMIRDVIRQTLAPITDLQGVRVRLNRADAEVLLAARGTVGPAEMEDRIEIVADAAMGPGDVMIESRNGYFDARIGERIQLVQDRLRQRLNNGHETKQ
jgi:flagellar biosynthesis/type III secretory pathway protein FliH